MLDLLLVFSLLGKRNCFYGSTFLGSSLPLSRIVLSIWCDWPLLLGREFCKEEETLSSKSQGTGANMNDLSSRWLLNLLLFLSFILPLGFSSNCGLIIENKLWASGLTTGVHCPRNSRWYFFARWMRMFGREVNRPYRSFSSIVASSSLMSSSLSSAFLFERAWSNLEVKGSF